MTIADVRNVGIEYFLQGRGTKTPIVMGRPTYNEIADLLGWPLLTIKRPDGRNQRLPIAKDEPIWTPDDVIWSYDPPNPQKTPAKRPSLSQPPSKPAVPRQPPIGLEFTFICPTAWVFNRTSMLRAKIEHGLLFFKLGGKRTGFQDMPIISRTKRVLPVQCKASITAENPFSVRVLALLRQIGWTRDRPFFALREAQRGWYGIVPGAYSEPAKPVAERSATGFITISPCVRIEETIATRSEQLQQAHPAD
jgi:hypothetical protein